MMVGPGEEGKRESLQPEGGSEVGWVIPSCLRGSSTPCPGFRETPLFRVSPGSLLPFNHPVFQPLFFPQNHSAWVFLVL